MLIFMWSHFVVQKVRCSELPKEYVPQTPCFVPPLVNFWLRPCISSVTQKITVWTGQLVHEPDHLRVSSAWAHSSCDYLPAIDIVSNCALQVSSNQKSPLEFAPLVNLWVFAHGLSRSFQPLDVSAVEKRCLQPLKAVICTARTQLSRQIYSNEKPKKNSFPTEFRSKVRQIKYYVIKMHKLLVVM